MTDETKEFASIEDATPTTAIPSETDATTATTTMVTVDDRTDTTVLPSAADDDETAVLPVPDNHADASVSDVDTQATAASPSPIEPTTDRIALETVADAVEGDGGPIPSADDVPMYAANRVNILSDLGADDFVVLAESAIADGYYLRRSGTDSGNSGRCMGHSRCRQEEKIALQTIALRSQ